MSPGRNPLWNTRVKDSDGGDIFIPVRDAASYIDEAFLAALEVFGVTETLGCLPFAGGWAEQPEWIVRALVTLKTERNRADEEERKAKLDEEEERRKHVR